MVLSIKTAANSILVGTGAGSVTLSVDSGKLFQKPQNSNAVSLNSSQNYANIESLPTSGFSAGDFAFVGNNSVSNNTLYFNNGSGWYKIALVNQTPTVTLESETLSLSVGKSANISYTATDPDGPRVVSVTVSNSGIANTSEAIISVDTSNNVLTITGGNTSSTDTRTVTLKASDGIGFGFDNLSLKVYKHTPHAGYMSGPNGNIIKFDKENNIIIGGHIVDSGEGMYFLKASAAGNIIWQKKYQATGAQSGTDSGVFEVNVDSNNDIIFLADNNYSSNYSNLIGKLYGSNGDVDWVKSFNGTRMYDFALDSSDDIVMGGHSTGAGNPAVFYKISNSGTKIWSKSVQGDQRVYRVDINSNNDIIAAGSKLQVSYNQTPKFLALNSEGNLLYSASINSSQYFDEMGGSEFLTVKVDENNDYYLGGPFLAKVYANNSLAWAKGNQSLYRELQKIYDIAITGNNEVLVCGFRNTGDTSTWRYMDGFISKQSAANGNIIWNEERSVLPTGSDQSQNDTIRRIVVDNTGDLYGFVLDDSALEVLPQTQAGGSHILQYATFTDEFINGTYDQLLFRDFFYWDNSVYNKPISEQDYTTFWNTNLGELTGSEIVTDVSSQTYTDTSLTEVAISFTLTANNTL